MWTLVFTLAGFVFLSIVGAYGYAWREAGKADAERKAEEKAVHNLEIKVKGNEKDLEHVCKKVDRVDKKIDLYMIEQRQLSEKILDRLPKKDP